MTALGPVGLRWAIKRSFVDYIGRMPDGRMSVLDGASQVDRGELVWEPAAIPVEATPEDADRFFAFRGDVRYGGHGGMLFVQVADPWVSMRGGEGLMTVIDAFSKVPGARIPLVTFTVAGSFSADGVDLVSADDVRLTEQGTHVFNTVYGAGESFEPLTIMWPADSGSTPVEQRS